MAKQKNYIGGSTVIKTGRPHAVKSKRVKKAEKLRIAQKKEQAAARASYEASKGDSSEIVKPSSVPKDHLAEQRRKKLARRERLASSERVPRSIRYFRKSVVGRKAVDSEEA